MDLPDRFWAKVDITPDHWLWTACTTGGYGVFWLGHNCRAHRLTYEWWYGEPVPEGLEADHWCQTRACVNPTHLRPVTGKQNRENVTVVLAGSGYRNVYRNRNAWRVMVRHNGALHYGGNFTTPEEANIAAMALRDRLFTHHLDGEQPLLTMRGTT